MIGNILGRSTSIFDADFNYHKKELLEKVNSASFVIVGGAGSIGSSVVKALISLKAKKIQIVDISENNLVELIRDIRSSVNSIKTEIETYALDCSSLEFRQFFLEQNSIDYLLNFSAIKHVRSERDPFTLKRLVDVNILNSVNLLNLANTKGCKKYFCVSTDKATNPINMMGASKLLMEKFILSHNFNMSVSTARFANVAFSDGSLLYGFEQRLKKKQPLAIPTDIRRFFVSGEEAGKLCVISCLMAGDKEILFPKVNRNFKDISIVEVAERYLKLKGFKPYKFEDEKSAKESVEKYIKDGFWPCFYFSSDTTGEKKYEEFFTQEERTDLNRFESIGVVNFDLDSNKLNYEEFLSQYEKYKKKDMWRKTYLVNIFKNFLPNFLHDEKNKNLDQKM